jgi:hypothetical protein
MYSKQEAAAIKRKFWTTLGRYMKPIPSTWQENVSWLNYKTGIEDIFFRMNADNKHAGIAIEITHNDSLIRQIFYNHFVAMKSMLHHALGEDWDWMEEAYDEYGHSISLIQTKRIGVNIMDEKHWPEMISFFKPRLIALDAFWGEVRDSMEGW